MSLRSMMMAVTMPALVLHAGGTKLDKAPKTLMIQTGKQYRDYYGTTITKQPKLLSSPAKTYRWGITNPQPQEMAYFGGTLLSDARHNQRLQATLFVDAGLKAPVVFNFKAGDRNGATLDTITVKPGETVPVGIALNGTKSVFFVAELKINHGNATRIILGEPTFE